MIDFTRSGRRRKGEATNEKFQTLDDESLKMCRNICTVIASAVIQQWVADGKPKIDEPMILMWKQVLKEGLYNG